VESALARADASKQAIDYARAQQVPSLSLGVQYQREGTGDQVLVGTLSMPIVLWKPWRFQEARQRVHHDRDRAHADMVAVQLKRLIREAQHEVSHAQSQYNLLKETGLPPRKEAVRIVEAQFASGATDFLRVSLLRRELLNTEESLVAALADVHHARIRLSRFNGTLRKEIR
jgi:outer membrane protein TolC